MGGDSGGRPHAFRSLAGNRALVRVLAGYALFVLTEYSAWIAMLVFAYGHGGATVAGIVAAAQLVPGAILAPVMAAIADRRYAGDACATSGGLSSGAEQALGSGVIRVESGGYRFADPVTAARLAAQLAPALRPTVMNEIATRLIDLDAAAARVAGLLLAAGEPAMAAPFALEAARRAAASGLYAEVLRWTEAVRDHVDGEAEPALLSLRADALAAVGDHAAVPAYRKAVATASPDQAAGLGLGWLARQCSAGTSPRLKRHLPGSNRTGTRRRRNPPGAGHARLLLR